MSHTQAAVGSRALIPGLTGAEPWNHQGSLENTEAWGLALEILCYLAQGEL